MSKLSTQDTGAHSASKTLKLAGTAAVMNRALINRESKGIVGDALKSIDAERVTSAPGVMADFYQYADTVYQDRELSDEGKGARVRARAESQMSNLARVASDIAALEVKHRTSMASSVPIAKAEAADVMIDLALVQYVREQAFIPTILVQQSERLRLAVVRSPIELSGVTIDTLARVRGSLMSPEMAVQVGEEAQALAAAREVTQAAINELQGYAQLAPANLVKLFGKTWRLPGVVDAEMVERMKSLHQETTGIEG